MKTSEKIDAIAPALADLQADIVNVKSTSTNPFYHSKYADLASIVREVRPLLAEHRLAILQGADGRTLTTRIVHESGQWIESSIELSVPKWENPQDVGKAMTYARRYELAAILNIAQEDDDGNSLAQKSTEVKPITAPQAFDLQSLIDDVGADLGKFLEFFHVDAIADLPENKYRQAIDLLEKKRG